MKPLSPQVLALLVKARARVCSGWPSVEVALLYGNGAAVAARLEAIRARNAKSQPWVQDAAEALDLVATARKAWGSEPAAMPPASSDVAKCAAELGEVLRAARAVEARHVAWEDPGGLTRPQAACVLSLAICLENWRVTEQRLEAAAEKARAELERERQANTKAAAQRIWGSQQKREPPPKEPRSLRDLARGFDAFSDWGEDAGEERDA